MASAEPLRTGEPEKQGRNERNQRILTVVCLVKIRRITETMYFVNER